MSTVGTIAKLAENVVGRTMHAVIHPIETVSYVAGMARGAASAVIGGVRPGERHATNGEWVPPQPGEKIAGMPDLAPPLPPMEGEQFATEPSSPSRNAEHGGPGDDSIDSWQEEWDNDADVETPVGTTGAGPGFNPSTGETDLQQPDTEPLMDPSLTKAVKSEAEIMQKASDPVKE